MKPHVCGDECVCPVHGTPMIYWRRGDDHACQDRSCEYGQGVRVLMALEPWEMLRMRRREGRHADPKIR